MSDLTFLAGNADWWRQAVVYQIYPRSFKDDSGDGVGDLRGIISKVDYLSDLGVNAVWLSPFYPSALADGGYDVDDYRDVDPRIGTLSEFSELVTALHAKGIRIFVDIVPNHCSNRHEWFRSALASPKGSKERERFIFRDGRGERGELPPSDLASHFGPLGWTQIEDGQWYMHLFAKEQPDLNWDNPEVHEDFLKTLKFWSDRGVDGFRVDVAHALKKQLEPLPIRSSFGLEVMKNDGTDSLFDRDEVHDIYRDWRKLFNKYDPPRVAVAEAWVHPERRASYASIKGLGQAFNFSLLVAPFSASAYRDTIEKDLAFAAETGSSSTWVLSNHDVIRHATRLSIPGYGSTFEGFDDENSWYVNKRFDHQLNLDLGLRRAKAATLLVLALPGSTYLYQGEELGLPEVLDLPDEQMQDPQWSRGQGRLKSRDGCRVPLPWEPTGESFGFGEVGAHLPQPSWFAEYSVQIQELDPNSTLNLYRAAIRLRSKLLSEEQLFWLDAEDGVLAFERPGGWISVTNFTASPIKLPEGELLLSSGSARDRLLPEATTAWLKRK